MKIKIFDIIEDTVITTLRDFRAYLRWIGWRWAGIILAFWFLIIVVFLAVIVGLEATSSEGAQSANSITDSSLHESFSPAANVAVISIALIAQLVYTYLTSPLQMRLLAQSETPNISRSYGDILASHGGGFFMAWLIFLLSSILYTFLISVPGIIVLVLLLGQEVFNSVLSVFFLAVLWCVWLYLVIVIVLRRYLRVFAYAVSCFDSQQNKKELRHAIKTQVIKSMRHNRFRMLLMLLLTYLIHSLVFTLLFVISLFVIAFVVKFVVPFVTLGTVALVFLYILGIVFFIAYYALFALFTTNFYGTAFGKLFSQLRRASEQVA